MTLDDQEDLIETPSDDQEVQDDTTSDLENQEDIDEMTSDDEEVIDEITNDDKLSDMLPEKFKFPPADPKLLDMQLGMLLRLGNLNRKESVTKKPLKFRFEKPLKFKTR